jgi:hypothetical protein
MYETIQHMLVSLGKHGLLSSNFGTAAGGYPAKLSRFLLTVVPSSKSGGKQFRKGLNFSFYHLSCMANLEAS